MPTKSSCWTNSLDVESRFGSWMLHQSLTIHKPNSWCRSRASSPNTSEMPNSAFRSLCRPCGYAELASLMERFEFVVDGDGADGVGIITDSPERPTGCPGVDSVRGRAVAVRCERGRAL